MKKHTGASTHVTTRTVEQCWILIGTHDGEIGWHFRRRCQTSGEVASVEAAWVWALEREERLGDVVGFFHTHPGGAGAEPSSRDMRTMRAWCSALGKPLLCVITDGKQLNGYIFDLAHRRPIPAENVLKEKQGWYMAKGKKAIWREHG
jgi:proteasome lid subunit RPN8/RPN11